MHIEMACIDIDGVFGIPEGDPVARHRKSPNTADRGARFLTIDGAKVNLL
jgi:hypothetical protein